MRFFRTIKCGIFPQRAYRIYSIKNSEEQHYQLNINILRKTLEVLCIKRYKNWLLHIVQLDLRNMMV